MEAKYPVSEFEFLSFYDVDDYQIYLMVLYQCTFSFILPIIM